MNLDDSGPAEAMLGRFNRLFKEVLRKEARRNAFEPWEIGILLDMKECRLDPRRRTEILEQYQRAVRRQMQTGPGPPMRLSEFLRARERRRADRVQRRAAT